MAAKFRPEKDMDRQSMEKRRGFHSNEPVRKKRRMVARFLPLLMAMLCGISGCAGGGEVLPADMLGVWVTETPAYQERFFEITRVSIVFATGPESADAYVITRVKKENSRPGIDQFTIIHEDKDGHEYELVFLYFSGDRPVIQFAHQTDMRWEKLSGGGRVDIPGQLVPVDQ